MTDMTDQRFEPLRFERLDTATARERVRAFAQQLRRRRSVRDFSPESVPLDLLESAVEAAASRGAS